MSLFDRIRQALADGPALRRAERSVPFTVNVRAENSAARQGQLHCETVRS